MTLYTEQVARERHRCGWDCGSPIEPGTRYVRAALPPGSDPNYAAGWWTLSLHGRQLTDCPTYNPELPSDPVARELVWQA
jgi:hypothetical protein